MFLFIAYFFLITFVFFALDFTDFFATTVTVFFAATFTALFGATFTAFVGATFTAFLAATFTALVLTTASFFTGGAGSAFFLKPKRPFLSGVLAARVTHSSKVSSSGALPLGIFTFFVPALM